MRKVIVAGVVGALLALGAATPTLAHTELDPCAESAEPGHSEFAEHHVRPLVPEAGHNPGEHQGLKGCERK
jgi:hypothetical protein